jgi:hypothetical protein
MVSPAYAWVSLAISLHISLSIAADLHRAEGEA